LTDAEHSECCAAQARITDAATEARVVREIVKWLRDNGWDDVLPWIERGDWRAKGPR